MHLHTHANYPSPREGFEVSFHSIFQVVIPHIFPKEQSMVKSQLLCFVFF